MYFLLSGEGVTDIGSGKGAATICEGDDFIVGPMTIIIDKVIDATHDYSIRGGACGFVSETSLDDFARVLRSNRKSAGLPGKRKAQETGYFFRNARILARVAMKKESELKDEVVAILFRDADGTSSSNRGLWKDKWNSMVEGFAFEKFERGVPMIPKPKSEAWLICALKKSPYKHCEQLEERSGNDASPNSLKNQLVKLLGDEAHRELLCRIVDERLDIEQLRMPSFQAFRERLQKAIR